MRGKRKLFAVILAAGLSVMSSICAFADVKTLDNGVQAIVCKGTNETGNVTVNNKTFMVSNATKKPMNVVMQGTVVKTLQSNESWAIGTNMDCVLGYTYSAKDNTLTITEANAPATQKTTSKSAKNGTKPSGSYLASSNDVTSLADYAYSLGLTVDVDGAGQVYFYKKSKAYFIISLGNNSNAAMVIDIIAGGTAVESNISVDKCVECLDWVASH